LFCANNNVFDTHEKYFGFWLTDKWPIYIITHSVGDPNVLKQEECALNLGSYVLNFHGYMDYIYVVYI